MLGDPVQIAVLPGTGAPGTCDLCATPATHLVSTLCIEHARGGAVRFEACERCTAALRRLAAVAAGPARFVVAPEAGVTRSPAAASGHEIEAPPGAPPAELIQERPEYVHDAAGTSYLVRVLGQPRPDGTWTGWIEFVPRGGGAVLRTDPETTQSSREQVAYWASGLEPLYFEGAFHRARPVGALA
ncbi:MAG TPA: hypothetical protein VK066_31010 [Chloroflexota bacterium]|nr:hypothetical protein [Chloroflexota bacterium]